MKTTSNTILATLVDHGILVISNFSTLPAMEPLVCWIDPVSVLNVPHPKVIL